MSRQHNKPPRQTYCSSKECRCGITSRETVYGRQGIVHPIVFQNAHLPPYLTWRLQLNFTNSLQSFEATTNMFHSGRHSTPCPFRSQPYTPFSIRKLGVVSEHYQLSTPVRHDECGTDESQTGGLFRAFSDMATANVSSIGKKGKIIHISQPG